MDGAVLFPRRLGKDLNPRVQDFVPQQLELGLPATEQRLEQLVEMAISLVVGMLQTTTGLPINLQAGIFQRLHRLFEILRLAIEIDFTFTLAGKLLNRRKMNSAQRVNFR